MKDIIKISSRLFFPKFDVSIFSDGQFMDSLWTAYEQWTSKGSLWMKNHLLDSLWIVCLKPAYGQ